MTAIDVCSSFAWAELKLDTYLTFYNHDRVRPAIPD
jgi:hypothetical protein